MRVSIVGEDLHAVVAVDALGARTRRSVSDGISGNSELLPTRARQHQRICRARTLRLQVAARLAQMNRMCAHVPHLKDPIPSELALYGEVPLLRVGRYEPAGHDQAEDVGGGNARTTASVIPRLASVRLTQRVEGKILKCCQTWNESGINCARIGQRVRVGTGATRFGCRREKDRHTTGRSGKERDGQEGRLEAELVDGPDIFADIVDAIATTDGRRMMAEQVPGKADAGTPAGGVIVLVRCVAACWVQSSHIQFLYAIPIDEGVLTAIGKIRVEISDMTEIVVECPKHFGAQSQVQSEVTADFPVILREESKIIGAVLVIKDASATEAEINRTGKKFLKVCGASGGVHKKQLSIEHLRKELVEIDAGVFASEAEDVGSLDPAHGVDEVVIVLGLKLVGRGRGTDLESRATEKREFVNGFRDAVGRPNDTQIVCRHRRDVYQAIVDAHVAEAKVIYKRSREQVRVIDAQETHVDRQVVGEVKIRSADAAGQSSPQRRL